MATGEEVSGVLKRRRNPLSDSDYNNNQSTAGLSDEATDGLKRRRLEAAGQENHSPSSSSGRPGVGDLSRDTPIGSPGQPEGEQVLQGSEGAAPLAPRYPPHPAGGADQLLGEGEFNQRRERFKSLEALGSSTPTPSPSSTHPLTRSSFVTVLQQKLSETTTQTCSQSRLRQVREQELNQLQFRPISENPWLKRSSPAPALAQDAGTADWDQSSTPAAAAQPSGVDPGTSQHNTSAIIDQMFQEVLEYAEQMEEQEQEERQDKSFETSPPKEEKQRDEEGREEEELLVFPSSGILSPLSKAIETAVTPLRVAASQESSNPPSLLLSPEQRRTPPPEAAPLYSVDAYRTQRRKQPQSPQSVIPAAPGLISRPPPACSSRERISALGEEAARLQTVISQTLQALGCCTDEEHGRGSLEEAEAEKLLLVSCERRSALLTEVSRLREEGEAAEAGVSQQACRGTVTLSNIRLPLKVEFLCSSRGQTGRPSHYFFLLIRYGACKMVATPLATAADAQDGHTISFPTSVTLRDILSSFEIDMEVYSLSNTSGSSCIDRAATKARVTPRKLLSSITQRSSNTMTSVPPGPGTRRSSNFSLVGSHRITLASLGHSRFPLDKMKLDGKIRRLLGDEFQEKVPFLSPLEGTVLLQLDACSLSSVKHQGFLTMFSLVSGFGVWNRRFFVLEGCNLSYWNHPNDRETKEADGSWSLSSCPSQCVRTVQREWCARPFTFELVSGVQQDGGGVQQDGGGVQQDGGGVQQDGDAAQKRWFSADTRQEKHDWMEKLSQALLDFHTWERQTDSRGGPASGT